MVNEEFFFKASQRPGNQSSPTFLLLLSVRLNVVTDVFCAKPSNTPRRCRKDPISDMPSLNSFIVRLNVVIVLLFKNPFLKLLSVSTKVVSGKSK